MRPIVLPSTKDNAPKTSFSSGPGAVLFENSGPHTRIYRAPVRAIGCVRFDDKEIYGQVLDVSPGGCLFKTESTLETGTVISMRVTLISPDSRAVAEVNGVICRTANDSDERPTYGVEFIAESPRERESLQWLYSKAVSL